MNGDGNVVRVKRWNKRQELEDELERQRQEQLAAESQPIALTPVEPVADSGPSEPKALKVESSGPITISYFSFLVCAAMIGLFLIRGAIGFATDWLAQ